MDPVSERIGKQFREGKRTIKIPLKGQQKLELKNLSNESKAVQVHLRSMRFVILEGLREGGDHYMFSTIFGSKHSIVFTIWDRGFCDAELDHLSASFEGVIEIMVSDEKVVKGRPPHNKFSYAPDILLTTDPESPSYRKTRDFKDTMVDWIPEMDLRKQTNLISIEPIPEDKYSKNVPKNVKILKLSENEKEANRFHDARYTKNKEWKKAVEEVKKMDQDELLKQLDDHMMKMLNGEYEKSEKSKISELTTGKSKKLDKSEKSEISNVGNEKSAKSSVTTPSEIQKSEAIGKSEDVKIQNTSISKDFKDPNIEKKMKKKKKKCVIM